MDRSTVGARALASTGIMGALSAAQFAVGFGLQVVLARLLAPDVFGQFAFVLLVQGFVASARTIQAGEYLVVCHKDDVRTALDTVFTTDLVLSALTTLVVVLFAHPVMRVAGRPELAGALRLSIVACLFAPLATPLAIFQREIDFASTARARVAGLVVGPVVKIGLALAGYGLWCLVWGEVIRQLVEITIVWRIAPIHPRLAFDRKILLDALRFSLPISLSSLLVYYYWKVDDYVVGRMLGMEQLGYYWLAFRIPEYMMTLRNYFVPIVFAIFARLEEPDDRTLAFRRLTRLTAVALFPVALVALVHGDTLIRVLFGDRWAPAVPAFQLLMLTGALRMSTSYAGDLYKVSGRTWIFPLTSLVNAIGLSLGVFVLTLRCGITGTAAAVLAMIVVTMALTEVLLGRWFGVSPSRALVRPVAALATATLAGAGVRALVPAMGPVAAAADAVALVILFLVLVYVLDADVAADVRWMRGA